MKLSRKALSLILAGVLTLSLAAPALAVEEAAPWYAEAQAYVMEKGLMTGTDNGFEPEATVTRATVYQILFNMEGQPQADPSDLVDLDGEWFAPAAHWANGAQLVTGNTFHGNRIITRQEIVALLYGYMNFRKADVSVGENTNILSYPDVADVKEEAIPAFQWACGAGVVKGDEKGNLNPAATLTRAELAALLMRLPEPVATYIENVVAIEVPENDKIPAHTIPGIVTLPVGEGKFPAVVMLHGTGSDKNEAGGGYALAAPIMAKAGIATIRIDFMGCGESAADYIHYNYTSANMDAKAAADYMAGLENVDGEKLGVMGWSQGGTNALLAAAAFPETFKSVVTWAGATKLKDAGLFGDKTFDQAFAAAKKDGSYEMTFDWREPLQLGRRWFEEVQAIDVLKETAKIKGHVTAIAGDQDTVVPVDEAVAIRKAAKDGQCWIVDGADHTYNIFTGDLTAIRNAIETTISSFQLSLNGALSGKVAAISKYGNVTTDIPALRFAAADYVTGDVLSYTVGDKTESAPYGTGYSNVDNGQVIILPDTGTGNVATAINMGNFAKTYGLEVGSAISYTMGEKEGYLEEYEIRNIDSLRTNVREDYQSDEVFANFREVKMGDIPAGRLFRTSSPVNPELGRNTYADALVEKAGVKTVLNLADNEESMKAYEGYGESHYATLDVIGLNMGVDFAAEDFNAKLKTGLEFMIAHEGPYAIHCNEGKDRAGFTAALLEALCGAEVGEIVEDYMLSFENYYHVEYHSDRWFSIANSNIIKTLCSITGTETEAEMEKADLQKSAETYLVEKVGLTAEQVGALADQLTAK